MSQVVNIRSLFATLVVALTIGFASAQTPGSKQPGFTPPEPENGTGITLPTQDQTPTNMSDDELRQKLKEYDDKIAQANAAIQAAAEENERNRAQQTEEASRRVIEAKRRSRVAHTMLSNTLKEIKGILTKYGTRIWRLEYRVGQTERAISNLETRGAAREKVVDDKFTEDRSRLQRIEDALSKNGVSLPASGGLSAVPATGTAPTGGSATSVTASPGPTATSAGSQPSGPGFVERFLDWLKGLPYWVWALVVAAVALLIVMRLRSGAAAHGHHP